MEYISKSLNAMIWLAVGATAYAAGCAFLLFGSIHQLTGAMVTNTSDWNLGSGWLQFMGGLTALWRTAAAGLYVVALGQFFQAHATSVSAGGAALIVNAVGLDSVQDLTSFQNLQIMKCRI